ncbi:beta-mannosidase isoform X2 [Adelges cooleyi]|uniref:beta-mannosidase isoform X2 n=1 Tax=Adelges cooleyi TaxID=133065 RepID=UPI0021809032|nr:beta-mannosidase isoform X2 [Adelges cooleyi]
MMIFSIIMDIFLLAALLGRTVHTSTDHGRVRLLDSLDWRLTNSNGSVTDVIAKVPGGVFADLLANGVLSQDPLYRYNDVAYRWVSADQWTYSTTFNGQNVLNVTLNSSIKMANKYFNQSDYPIPPLCVPSDYHGECHVNYLRKMQSSFGWDWGPAFPSAGIWKSVKLIELHETLLEDIKTRTTIANSSHWLLKTDVYMKCFQKVLDGNVRVSLSADNNIVFGKERHCCNEICINDEIHVVVELLVAKTSVKTWWPNGYGDQPLYDLTAEFYSKTESQSKTVSIGFRTAELVQEAIDKNNSEKGLSFYLKINGVPIFAKGTNYIPSNVFPEKMNTKLTIEKLLTSAKYTHMNTIRVWGGGVYESDEFYHACDKLGIMVWQDMMFACAMYPSDDRFLDVVSTEVRQQIRRLQHHPSIVLWAGNNENEAALRGNWYGTQRNYTTFASDYVKLYADTIRVLVSHEDGTRSYVLSSPSNGLQSERENYVADNPYSALYGDVHYYNYEVNSWSSTFYPWTRFASEYGYQSLPSYQTLTKALNANDLYGFPSPALVHRQHLAGGYAFMMLQIEMNVPVPAKPTISDYIYLSQVVQARAIRIQTEWYRKHRNTLLEDGRGMTMGALYWQLNDVWQAPTWSSIDYDGRWKMLHYSALDFFASVIVVPELTANNLTIYFVSDVLNDLEVVLQIEIYCWSSIQPLSTITTYSLSIVKNSAQLVLNENYVSWLQTKTNKCGRLLDEIKQNCFLHTKLYYTNGTELSPSNYLFPNSFNKIAGYQDPTILISNIKQKNINEIDVELQSTGIGLFVWLNVTRTDGYFNENGFIMLNKTKTVTFTSSQNIESNFFTVEISHLKMNLTN